MNDINSEIKRAIETLSKGGVILYPTDTIWGIGCDATNEKAVEKIYKIKGRAASKSMIILLDDFHKLKKFTEDIPQYALKFIENSTKPLTIIYPKAKGIASNLIAKDGSIGIRIPKNEFCKKLVKEFGKPIVSTSANLCGGITPRCFKEINKKIISEADYVVNMYHDRIASSKPSTIMKFESNDEFKLLRK
ncbi:MAG: L-threonylcarbamoyladenylate synthase [Bacteroidales bacterium]|nr:L-threonylcarbamoyladenylate synthase [Bacteroidales bacterium]